ncbi:hypothetical protein J132_04677 [Termitomyces sp. J132]|nr:hypothetical protein H2248_010951 [Termitomyces sp. 'cryptogamus']KNZ75191.1 hypothetical protein J132_04677 [Termitomyces sp. J132]
MDATGLFSFLHQNADNGNYEVHPLQPDAAARNDLVATSMQDNSHGVLKQGSIENSVYPISIMMSSSTVTDIFETEAKRKIPSSAGLEYPANIERQVESKYQVRHQVTVPTGYPYIPITEHIPPPKFDREYKFELDPFQKIAIFAIQRNESVLVSAHTSAGKTVIAEYAIAQCLNRRQRVIYTSPIKALSNQKYREFAREFGDVGLMTGDVIINPSATCLVMTTEILRSMLYRGSEIVREVAWVIFDEIHYMRDKERGVVWEETIILLPHAVRCIFLSATIPNAVQFAEWICKLHEQPCHVVYTEFRPTPLLHYLFPAGDDGIYLVVNEKGEFREESFTKAMSKMQDGHRQDRADPKSGLEKRGKTGSSTKRNSHSDISKVMHTIKERNHNPTIVFAFSKRECERLALDLDKTNYNSPDECDAVTVIFKNALAILPNEECQLPQITNLLPLLRRGIGIHHGGLLPILKEVVEILFQDGLLKVLFATETFSIGLNMPAKTVVFTSTRKFDGREFRNISSGEYIQMSGRAGRRGLDDRGVVIMMCDEKLDPAAAKAMVKGEPDRLNSAFHLGYNMILNLMKVEGVSPEYMLQRCFSQYQSSAGIPFLETDLESVVNAHAAIFVPDEHQVADYYNIQQQLDRITTAFRAVVTHPTHSIPFLQPGRLVRIKYQKLDFGWGVIVNCQRRMSASNRSDVRVFPPHEQYVLDVLLNCASSSTISKDQEYVKTIPNGVQPCAHGQRGVSLIVPTLLAAIEGISHLRIFLPQDLQSAASRETVWKSVLEVQRRLPDGITLLDPIENMGINDVMFLELIEKLRGLESKLFSNPMHRNSRLSELLTLYLKKQESAERIRSLKKQIQIMKDVLRLEELKSRKRVLRRLGFITPFDTIDLKGRVASEISSGDELLLTELIFNGVFNPLSPEQCAALLSCFIFVAKSDRLTKLNEALQAPLRVMQEFARQIAKISKEAKLSIDENQYVASFKVELMEPVMQWCRGASFDNICRLTDQFEGDLIRGFRRLAELLRQLGHAADVMGNEELKSKFERASELLERPNSVIFCSSLHL